MKIALTYVAEFVAIVLMFIGFYAIWLGTP